MTSGRLSGGLVLLLAATTTAQSSQVFRSTTEVVLVDVQVREGTRPVRNLTAADFIVYDSGAPQRIDGLTVEQLPIDLTILLDTSGSTLGVADEFRRSADRVVSLLRREDRVRLMGFATDVVDLTPLGRTFPAQADLLRAPRGGTSLHDALLLTLARPTEAGRRHLVVVFTDGADTTSVAGAGELQAVANVSECALHVVVPAPILGRAPREPTELLPIQRAAMLTGGSIEPLSGEAVDALKRIFVDFRQSYVLRYTPTWKSLPGWHSLSVRVTKPGLTVRARRGYFR